MDQADASRCEEMSKILSVSIAAYNAEKDIDRCLESFLNSEVADELELLVVNDGSKDETATIVSRYVEKYPSIVRLINKENGGHGSTINTSLQQATGTYYKIVDSDDWVNKDGLERLVNWLKHHSVDLVLNPYEEIEASGKKVIREILPYNKGQRIGEIQSIDCANAINIYMHSITFNTDVVRQMGPVIDENCFYVDMEYTTFPMIYIQTYACLDYVVYQYLLGTATQSMNMKNMIARRDQHLRVIKNLISFVTNRQGTLQENVYQIVLHRIRLAVLSQYKIYANMERSQALQETREFDMWLHQYPDIYIGPEGRYMQLIRWNRRTNYIFYKVMLYLLRQLHMEPTL